MMGGEGVQRTRRVPRTRSHAAGGDLEKRGGWGRHAMAEMVRPEGFEPPTNGFGSHYSIRLSYERVVSCVPGRPMLAA